MRILNLVENEVGDSGCEAAHGLSFYVETDNHKLLFDSSPSEVVIRNAHFATCHCTGLPVFNQMKEIMGDELSYVRSGDEVFQLRTRSPAFLPSTTMR